ncbi:PEP-CTERM sorting domain-containing protein [Pseudoduganella sp. LjRoot289]|uniref:PEP-CTERM sorting domain-containing protein n=1 Tax=Pseudoduganella sp. LjRoot289 TaxID=3342314 RepID=UPI003ECC519B
MNRKLIVLPALISSIAFSSLPAYAATSTAEIVDFNMQLIDLDPADGIAPAFSILGGPYIHVLNYAYALGQGLFDHSDIETFGTLQHTYPYGSVFSMAAADTFASRAEADKAGTYSGVSSLGFDFSLTPNTSAVFTATATVSAHPRDGYRTYGQAFMMAMLFGGGDFYEQLSTADAATGEAGTRAFYGELHSGSAAMAGRFDMEARATAQVPEVPEPGSWAMLLAGIAVIGLAGARRLKPRITAKLSFPRRRESMLRL